MIKLTKKVALNLSVITAIMISTNGCSVKDIKEQGELNKFKEISKEYNNKKEKSIEEIVISGYTLKKSNLNHNIPDNISQYSLNLKNNKTLGDLKKIGNYPVIIDPLLNSKKINLDINLNGNLKSILNKLSYITNTYWTINNGIIKFKATTDIIYTFPALSLSKVSEIYNIGNTGALSLNTTETIFKDLKTVIDGLISSYKLSGTVSYSNNANSSYLNQKKKSNTKDKTINGSESSNSSETSSNSNGSENMTNSSNALNNNKNIDLSLVSKPTASEIKEQIKKGLRPISSKPAKGESIQAQNQGNSSQSDKESLSNNNESKNSVANSKDNKSMISNNSNTANSNNLKNENSISIQESYSLNNKRIIISPNSGTVIASVTPSEEKILDSVLNTIMKKRFSNMVKLRVYALLVNSERVKNFNTKFSSILNKKTGNSVDLSEGKFSYKIPGAGFDFSQIDLFSSMINYFISDSKGEVLMNPTLISLPNVISRIQDTSNIPYLEPTDLGNDSGRVSYGINYVEEGINLSAITNVFDNNIIMALKFNVTQYLGNKTVQAGVLGSFDLPLSAPKTIQTTFRLSPGDIMLLGGIKNNKYSKNNGSTFNLPTDFANSSNKSEFMFIVMPTLIKFVVNDKKENTPIKDLDLNKLNEKFQDNNSTKSDKLKEAFLLNLK